MEPRSFYVSYAKFSKVYAVYPFLFAFIAWGGLQVVEWLFLTLALTATAIWGSKKFFEKFLRQRTAFTVTDTALETYALSGEKQEILFTDLLGPFEDTCGPIKRFKFMSSSNSQLILVVTNMTEGFEELITLIQQKIHHAQQR